MLRYDRLSLDYEPYPIGLIESVFDAPVYDELIKTYPDVSLFKHMPKLGNKYSLSSLNNRNHYYQHLKDNRAWGKFHDYILSREFIDKTLTLLKERHIDLGFKRYWVKSGTRRRRSTIISRVFRQPEISARFEFSMMNGVGGNITPHTDQAGKIITFVFSMNAPGEWKNEAWGGGTAVVRPKDVRFTYNHVNKHLAHEAVEIVKEYPFNPNQALIFVKTHNSWHSVQPMRSDTDKALRRTLTVNIERLA
jgi:hypothetical protein